MSATQPPREAGEGGGVVLTLVLFLAALATLVLPCLRSAAQFFAAHRQATSVLPLTQTGPRRVAGRRRPAGSDQRAAVPCV